MSLPRGELSERICGAFPPRVVSGAIVSHSCPECDGIEANIRGRTWSELPLEFVRENSDGLPLLTHEAYIAYLPAWLQEAVADPGGDVASMLHVNLRTADTSGFRSEQAAVVVLVAEHIAEHNVFGPLDPVNLESVAHIKRQWARSGLVPN